MEWYQLVWKRFAEFSGRSRRKEYWMFALFNCLICLPLYIAGFLLRESGMGVVFLGLYFIYLLAALIPGLAVTVRRLHDTGKSAWWLLICLVPFVGGIIFLVFMVLEGTAGPNEYGQNPKFPAPSAAIV